MAAEFYECSPKAFIHTYGCQGNVSDSERIMGMLKEMGYEFTNDASKADLILYNTCAVREHAEDRVFGNVGAVKKYKKDNPHLIIALCGCMMQQEHIRNKIYSSYPFVDLVFGTHAVTSLLNCFTGRFRETNAFSMLLIVTVKLRRTYRFTVTEVLKLGYL